MIRYQNATGHTSLSKQSMTGYEIGRITREGRKIADRFNTLIEAGEFKTIMHFYIFMQLKNIDVWRFNKSQTEVWFSLAILQKEVSEGKYASFSLDPEEITQSFLLINEMIDSPLHEAPSRFVLLKMSLR